MESKESNEPIAIIGMACRFPGAPNLSALWDLLTRGGDAITEVPQDRYDINEYYDKRPATPGKTMSRYGGFLERVDLFDAAFFGISPREAAKIDPQHRLLLEVAWEAMEDAGLVTATMTEQEKLDIACFIGVITGDYWDRQFQDAAHLDVYATAGSARSGAAGRLSFSLDLKGTSFAIDAACSSSLVGVDQAVHNLRSGVYATALVGGVNIILNPDHAIGFSQGKMMAADGHCKAFDAAADGYVRSEGAGIVVLKRLSSAQADGDRIHAVIRGSASNNDGHCDSFMAPSTQGQQAGLRKACQNAGIDPSSINYVEAHGPGTKAGDPVEIMTLGEVLCPGRSSEHPLLVGSVKTNIGHLEGGAGVAGLIKTVLSLHYQSIPANLHFNTPSPSINWNYPVKIPTESTPWPDSDEPHRAVVCSYGIAGTNSYVVVEEAPPQQTLFSLSRAEEAPLAYFLPLSARSSSALTDLAQRYVEYLEDPQYAEQAWYDICYTAGVRRTAHDHRLAVISHSKQDAYKKLQTYLRGETSLELASGPVSSKPSKMAWIFPGQGSQWLGMGRDLLAQEPVFYAAIEQCDQVMRAYVDWSLLEQLQSNEALKDIDVIQPVLFAIEVALSALWRSWGVEPDAVVGHSMGETAAAYIAGVLSLDDAILIICRRSKLLRRTSGQGAMAAVELSLERAQTIVHDYKERVSVAVSNSPNSTVLAGDPAALSEILATLEQQGIFGRLVNVDVASHSPQMDPLRADLLSLLEQVQPGKAMVPLYSTVYGALVVGDELNAEYWINNVRQPVLFHKTIQELLKDGFTTFIEMSPHPILVGAIRQTLEQSDTPALTLASMRRNEPGRALLLTALGTLYAHGYDPNWKALYGLAGRHVSLPSYPWQHQSYWNIAKGRSRSRFASAVRQSTGTLLHPILGISTSSALHANTTFWTTDIDAEIFPYLSEHRVHGMPVFPGAAYIELALAAATETFGSQRFSVEGLLLKKALFFSPGTTQTIQMTLSPEAEEGTLCWQLFSKPAKEENGPVPAWVLHASAHIHVEEMLKMEDIMHPAPEQVQNEWTLAQEAAEFYQGLRARGVQHGPLFQSVTQIWRRAGEVMARLAIPQELADDMAGYQLHPALLDVILQGIIPFLPNGDEDETYVPVAIQQVKFYQKPTPGSEVWSHVIVQSDGDVASSSSTLEGNVILLNDQGQVLLEVLGLCLQSLDSNNTQDLTYQRLNQLLYAIEWEAQGKTNQLAKGIHDKNWLVLSEGHEPGNDLVKRLRVYGANCIMVIPGQEYRQVEEQVYELNPADPQEFQRLFSELYSEHVCHSIVYLWTVPAHEGTCPPQDQDQDMASIGVLHLLQALTAVRKEATLPPQLWLVTSGVHVVEEKDRMTALMPASVWGLGRVIVYEHPDLQTTLIDIDAGSPLEESFKALFEELWLDDGADEVALRGDRRYVARLVRQTLPEEQEQATPIFRADGTYLITGGLGGVGLRTAQWMIEQGARHIVLMGRHGATEETLPTIQALRDRGADIAIVKADVAQEAQLAAALADIRSTLPPLRGVFHSAVVLDDSILQQLDRERFLGVMPPKVDGTWNLHCLTLDDPLDYFVLFSSAASLIGSPGQGNYAAASAFMDALAYYRQQQGYPALTINWGRWGEVGQATKENRGERLDTRGFASMKSKDALMILGKLLQNAWQRPQIGIMSFNLSRWSQFFPKLLGSSLFVQLLKEAETQEESNGAKELHPTHEILAELDEEQRLQVLSHYLSDQVARILGHTSLKLDTQQPLNRLGIDSLMSVELKNRIASDLNVVIPVAAILQGITFGELTRQVLEQVN